MMVKSIALITLLLQTDNISCFTENARVTNRPFNHVTVRQGYLDNLSPAAAKGSGPKSYFPTIKTNPKPSTVASYLDKVSGATPAPPVVESSPAPVETAPAASAPVVSAGPSSATSNTFEYSNTFTYTDAATQQTHVHTHHHLHSYNYNYENDAVTIEDAQKVDVEVTVTKPGGAPVAVASAPVASAPAKSYAPAKKYAESTGQAGGVATGGYLTNLRTNVMSSGGGNSLQNAASYLPVTGKPCTGGMALGNSYLNAIPVTAAPCSGYNSLSNFASMMNAAIPLQTSDYAAAPVASTPPPPPPSTPARSSGGAPSAGGDYLSKMSSGGTASAPKSNWGPSGGGKKPVSGKTLGNSYLNF